MPFDLTPLVELERQLGPEQFKRAVEEMCQRSAEELDALFVHGEDAKDEEEA